MYKFIALCTLCAVIAIVSSESPPAVDPPTVPIVRSESNLSEDGSYSFTYEGADGNFREETGSVVNPGTDDESISVSGSYKYIDANGEEVSVTYTADENGFVPVGSIIAQEISDTAAQAKNLPDVEEHPVKPLSKN